MPAPSDAPAGTRPGFAVRVASMGYEILLVGAILFVAGYAFVGLTHYPDRPALRPWYQGYLVAIVSAYFVGFWTHGGQTPAMRAWRLRVETAAGEPVTTRRALLRAACAAPGVLLAGVGLWWAFLDPEGRFLHDRLAGTRLVRLPPPSPRAPRAAA